MQGLLQLKVPCSLSVGVWVLEQHSKNSRSIRIYQSSCVASECGFKLWCDGLQNGKLVGSCYCLGWNAQQKKPSRPGDLYFLCWNRARFGLRSTWGLTTAQNSQKHLSIMSVSHISWIWLHQNHSKPPSSLHHLNPNHPKTKHTPNNMKMEEQNNSSAFCLVDGCSIHSFSGAGWCACAFTSRCTYWNLAIFWWLQTPNSSS